MYVGTQDSKLQVYDVDTGKLRVTIDHNAGSVSLLQLSRDGKYMLAAGKTKIHVEDLQCKCKHLVVFDVGDFRVVVVDEFDVIKDITYT